MRRIVLVPLAVLAAAACQDHPTAPSASAAPDAATEARLQPTSASPITYFASPARMLGFTVGEAYRYTNQPEPDLGGDLVVWRYMADPYYGDATVHQFQVSTGTTTQVARISTYAGPHTSGRYTTWQDGLTGIMVLDNATGQRHRIAGQWPHSESVDIGGDRVAFIDIDAQTVEVYDGATGGRRVIARFGSGTPYYRVRDLGTDGRYVAWIAEGSGERSGMGMVVHDLQTGEDRVAVPFEQDRMTGPSVDAGRVVFSMDAGEQHPVFLYDVASGTTRRLSADAPSAQQDPEISGDLVVWEDTRQDDNPAYTFNHDVYLYDLRTGVEMPLANGPEWTSDPQLDGGRVVWTQRNGDRWEVMLAELAPASLAGLRDELRRMVESGAVPARTGSQLERLLARAASGEAAGDRAQVERWLSKFTAQVRRHAGRQIERAAAGRLEGMAAGVLARM